MSSARTKRPISLANGEHAQIQQNQKASDRGGRLAGKLSLEPIGLRKALWRQAAGFGAVADPFLELGPGDGERAPGRVAPGEAVGDGEDPGVGNAAVLIALKPRALAARHFVELRKREHEQLAVLPDDRDMVAGGGNDHRRGRRGS